MHSLCISLGVGDERCECIVPEGVDPCTKTGESVRFDPVEPPGSRWANRYKSGFTKNSEMLRHRRLCHGQLICQFTHTSLSISEKFDHGTPSDVVQYIESWRRIDQSQRISHH